MKLKDSSEEGRKARPCLSDPECVCTQDARVACGVHPNPGHDRYRAGKVPPLLGEESHREQCACASLAVSKPRDFHKPQSLTIEE